MILNSMNLPQLSQTTSPLPKSPVKFQGANLSKIGVPDMVRFSQKAKKMNPQPLWNLINFIEEGRYVAKDGPSKQLLAKIVDRILMKPKNHDRQLSTLVQMQVKSKPAKEIAARSLALILQDPENTERNKNGQFDSLIVSFCHKFEENSAVKAAGAAVVDQVTDQRMKDLAIESLCGRVIESLSESDNPDDLLGAAQAVRYHSNDAKKAQLIEQLLKSHVPQVRILAEMAKRQG